MTEEKRKEQLLEVVQTLTYKPGWTFAVEDYQSVEPGKRIIALNIQVQTVCIDSGEPITIDRSFIYGMYWPEGFVAGAIKEIEDHEIAEWLKFSGRRFYPEPEHE